MQPCGLLCADCGRRALGGGVAGEVPRTEMRSVAEAVKKALGAGQGYIPIELNEKNEGQYAGWNVCIYEGLHTNVWMAKCMKIGDEETRKFAHIEDYNVDKTKLLKTIKMKIDKVNSEKTKTFSKRSGTKP
jgi:hypothetical protein